jgi:hypothetical protein
VPKLVDESSYLPIGSHGMRTSRIVLTIAVASVVLASVAACTADEATTPSSAPSTISSPAPLPNTRTYTKADLTTILNTVNSKLQLTGGIAITDGPTVSALNATGAAIGNSPTITPASCAKFADFNPHLTDLLGTSGVIVGTSSGPHLNLIVATVSGETLPASLTSTFTTTESALLTTCKHLSITSSVNGQAVVATIDNTRLNVTTDAPQSVGFTENDVITSGGGGSTTRSTWIEAIDGSLVIFATSVIAPDQATLEKAVNATVAAARQ